MNKPKIIVIGGGPAGMMAAGQAALAEVDMLLFEKKKRPGFKLRITGKGRCNITNIAPLDECIKRFRHTGEFLRPAFSRFFNNELMAFMKDIGLEITTERGGRVFPASGKAPDVLAAMLQWVASCGVQIKCSSPVDKILIKNGRIAGIVSRNRAYACEAAILATGGASYPATGSTGDGYRLAAEASHRVVPIRPSLVPLTIKGNSAKMMDGVSLRNIGVRLHIDGKLQREAFGEVAFTATGIGGPVVLTLSGRCVDALDAGRNVALSLDLKAALSKEKLEARILRDMVKRGDEPFKSFMRGLLPRQVVSVCQIETGIAGKRLAKSITEAERKRLVTWLKDVRFDITGYRPFTEAIVTAGGVATGEIDGRTMQSRLVKGLYFAGEIMDVDADTGGYNLQAAFSTGVLAGCSAAAAVVKG